MDLQDLKDLQDRNHWRILRIEYVHNQICIHKSEELWIVLRQIGIQNYWYFLIWDAIWRHVGVLGRQFGTILVIIGCKGALRRVLECPNIDFHRFLMIFRWPVGITLGSLFDNLCDLRHQKACLDCRHASWWFLIGKIDDVWCPNLSKT